MKHSERGAYLKTPTKNESIGQRIQSVRKSWNWSQSQLAKVLGTNQQTVSHWEQGRQQPTEAALHSLALVFGMAVEALLSGNGFKVPDPPQEVCGIWVSANRATRLIELPFQCKEGITHISRNDKTAKPLSLQDANRLIRQAYKDGQPVWVVI